MVNYNHLLMIYLKKLPFVDTFDSMREVVEIDNLANLKKHLSALHSWVPSHYCKADYTLVIDASFVNDPLRLLSALSTPEQKAVMTLVGMKVDEYLTWPLDEDEELMMQTLHLVISYEDGDQWRLYMPDCIRRELYRAQRAEFMNLLSRMSRLK